MSNMTSRRRLCDILLLAHLLIRGTRYMEQTKSCDGAVNQETSVLRTPTENFAQPTHASNRHAFKRCATNAASSLLPPLLLRSSSPTYLSSSLLVSFFPLSAIRSFSLLASSPSLLPLIYPKRRPPGGFVMDTKFCPARVEVVSRWASASENSFLRLQLSTPPTFRRVSCLVHSQSKDELMLCCLVALLSFLFFVFGSRGECSCTPSV